MNSFLQLKNSVDISSPYYSNFETERAAIKGESKSKNTMLNRNRS